MTLRPKNGTIAPIRLEDMRLFAKVADAQSFSGAARLLGMPKQTPSGFDIAFRVGHVDDKRLSSTQLGPARVRFCASPAYVRARGAPRNAEALGSHDCLVVHAEGEPVRWPVPTKKGIAMVPVGGRFRFNTFAMTYAAALAGLGIALCPDFACAGDLRSKRLVAVLDRTGVDVGAVSIAHPTQRYLSARIRSFVELAVARLGGAPWVTRVDAARP